VDKINTAAASIKRNMSLAIGGLLSDQEVWEVAAFMNRPGRPQDPRHEGDLAATTEQFHAGRFDYSDKRKSADGQLLGERPAGN
jgi:thiosulfate dehydrogenase